MQKPVTSWNVRHDKMLQCVGRTGWASGHEPSHATKLRRGVSRMAIEHVACLLSHTLRPSVFSILREIKRSRNRERGEGNRNPSGVKLYPGKRTDRVRSERRSSEAPRVQLFGVSRGLRCRSNVRKGRPAQRNGRIKAREEITGSRHSHEKAF